MRSALDSIANADQFFIIRYLTVQNSAPEGPKRVEEANGQSAPAADPSSAPKSDGTPAGPQMRRLAGWETLSISLRIEMITFNNLPSQK